jgi:hypothetical protein
MLRSNLSIQLEPVGSHEENERAKKETFQNCAKIDALSLTRNEKICAKRLLGMTFNALAEEYGLCRARIIQITHKVQKPSQPDPTEEWVNHAFRGALLDWVRTQKDIKEVLWRAQVDHELGETQADSRYGGDLLLEERRAMMLRYEKYIDNPPSAKRNSANVVPFGNKRTA